VLAAGSHGQGTQHRGSPSLQDERQPRVTPCHSHGVTGVRQPSLCPRNTRCKPDLKPQGLSQDFFLNPTKCTLTVYDAYEPWET